MKLSTLGLEVTPKLLVTPYHEDWLKANPNLKYTDKALEFAAKQLAATQRDRSGGFSASSIGSCLRQQQLIFLGMPSNPLKARQHQVGHNGVFMHLRWQLAGLSAGWLTEAEVGVPSNEWGLSGTMDGVLQDGEGVEFKSINSHGYSSIRSFGPKEEHIYQVHTYMLATGIEMFSVIYENKDTQDFTEIIIESNPKIMDKIKHAADGLWNDNYLRRLAPRLEKCEYKEGWRYDWCSQRESCFAVETYTEAKNAANALRQ